MTATMRANQVVVIPRGVLPFSSSTRQVGSLWLTRARSLTPLVTYTAIPFIHVPRYLALGLRYAVDVRGDL